MTQVPDEHDHDDEGNCIITRTVVYTAPNYRFSLWDVAGIVTTTVGGIFSVVGQGCNLLATEFSSMANWTRDRFDMREAQEEYDATQAAIVADIEKLVGPSLIDAPNPEDLP